MQESTDITQILLLASEHDPLAVNRLFVLLYDDLHRIAEERLRHERRDHTLQATALLNEAYLRLIDQSRCQWRNRAHFLAAAAKVMRRILVDYARARGRWKRGGQFKRVPMREALTVGSSDGADAILALHDALEALEKREPEKAQVVEMRFFGGLTQEECAEVLGLSARTVRRHWQYAQAWLYREMTADLGPA